MIRQMRWMVSIGFLVTATAWVPAAPPNADLQQLREDNLRLRRSVAELSKRVAKLTADVEALRARVDEVAPAAASLAPARRKLDIRVRKDNWGGAGSTDIQKVLLSAAGEIWKHTGDGTLRPILVRRSTSGPISLYKKGPRGEYVVKLDVNGLYWCQFAYQFAHEFCHILTHYDKRRATRFQWFDESLCELASLYAVARMAESWKTKPPYPHWRSYSAALATYAKDIRTKKDGQLPADTTFLTWLAKHREQLQKNPTNRSLNRVVAYRLLDLFEADPAGWDAAGYLNLTDPGKLETFEDQLHAWHTNCPDRLRPFVAKVMARFGVKPK